MPHHVLNLTIPSLHHDHTPLSTTLHVPPHAKSRRAAILAHPYGPLGGSLHDPVIVHLTSTLLAQGYTVAAFNFRSRTSWTGAAETKDFLAVAAWVLTFTSALSLGEGVGDEVEMVLGGYSYGALVAAQCPDIVDVIQGHWEGGLQFSKALHSAAETAERWEDAHGEDAPRRSYSGGRSPRIPALPPSPALAPKLGASKKRVNLKVGSVRISWLLVSPPLGAVRSLLFLGGISGKESVVDVETASKRVLSGGKMFAVWGDEDGFTAVKRYRKWSEKMHAALKERWVGVELPGGHFWNDQGLAEIRKQVNMWVR